ncbi:hypothetical protein CPC08DRAFT_672704 [Agrocybe pediades]|nr:hypothetical protein CPC08DRAFT_672704 [Agrocybe pediades]
MSPNPFLDRNDDAAYMLSPAEQEWVQLQPFFLKHGYRLPLRYRPKWKPSWKKRRLWGSKRPWNYSDSFSFYKAHLIDAVRISDGKKVVLKRVNPEQEVAVLQHLHSPELAKDPRNNTVPLLDVLYHPDKDDVAFIVMPMLYPFETPFVPFEYVSEVLEALDQFLKGLEFLHEQQIAHRDACLLNFMMDVSKVLPGGFHFAEPSRRPDGKRYVKPRSRRTVGPIKYYFIDYELALYYPGNEHDSYGRFGQDQTAPEFADEQAVYDPFKLDVYQLGGVISFLVDRYGLAFLSDLEAQMRCRDPSKRLTATEAYKTFSDIVKSLPLAEMSRKITWRRKEIGQPLLGPEKYEKPTDSEANINSTNDTKSVVADDSRHRRASFISVDALDTSSTQVAEAIASTPMFDFSTTDSTEPAADSQPTHVDTNEPGHDRSVLDNSLSSDTSPSVINSHSETTTRSIRTTHSINTAPTSIGSMQSHGLDSANASHSIRTAQSIDTLPTSIGSAQSQIVQEESQIIDTNKPEPPSPPSEPPAMLLLSLNLPPSPPAAGPAKSKPTTRSNHRRWSFLFSNIKRSFRS